MPPLNYTTKIPVARTVGECQSILAKAGADAVSVTYTEGRPSGLGFLLRTPHGQRAFSLPVNVDAMRVLLTKAGRGGAAGKAHMSAQAFTSVDHAERVAWRVTKDWLEANLALIDAQMATLDQVMLPYLHVRGELTLYEAYREQESVAAITAGDR